MTTDDQQQETNQAIFDEYVKFVVGVTEVDYMDESIEHIIETIEHGEASVETAINLIARAHVIFMVLTCPTQLNSVKVTEVNDLENSPPWIIQLTQLVPKIGPALDKCADLLESIPTAMSEEEDVDISSLIETAILPGLFSAPSLKKLTGKKLFGDQGALDAFVFAAHAKTSSQSDSGQTDDAEEARRTVLGRLARLNLDIKPTLRSFPSWYWHRVGHEISECLSLAESLTFSEWCGIVDFVADLMRQSEMDADYKKDNHREQGGVSNYPVWSTENWAWQFGRVASLYRLAEPDPEGPTDGPPSEWGLDIELIENWDNGLAAQSLIAHGPHLGHLQESDQSLAGLLAVGNRGRGTNEEKPGESVALLPLMQLPTSRLYWIMRLGYIEGAEAMRESTAKAEPLYEAGPPKVSTTTAGTETGVAETTLQQMIAELGAAMAHELDSIQRQTREQMLVDIAARLGDVWNILPQDIGRHLGRAHQALNESSDLAFLMADPVLEMALAVEIALRHWLIAPQRERGARRDGSLGNWISWLTNSGLAARNASLEDPAWRDRYDWGFADELTVSLYILRENRNAVAHPPGTSSEPTRVAEIVFGGNGSGSIFELILRFARKWPPK